MGNLTISCDKCKAQLDHRCDAELLPAIVRFLTWTPENNKILDPKGPYYSKGDEDAPFVSEAFLYNLLGKEDARTFMALFNHVIAATGLDPYMGVREAVNAECERLDQERAERKERDERAAIRMATFKRIDKSVNKETWVPDEDWHALEHLSKRPDRWEVGEPGVRKGVQGRTLKSVEKDD